MNKLTEEQFEKLIKKYGNKKGFRPLPVRNFLMTSHNLSELDARSNLNMDARLYSWKAPIVNAISDGLKMMR